MHTKVLLFFVTLSLPLFAQIYDFDEPQQQPKQEAVAEDTITDELPAPLPDATIYRPRVSTATATTSTRVELVPTGENFAIAQKLAGMGAGLYFTGLGLSYGIALPLSISAANQEDTTLSLVSSIINVIANGFKISGTTRNGIGASIAYNVSLQQGLKADRNINWGFYKAGWAFAVIAELTGVILQLGISDMDAGTAGTLSLILLTSNIATDAMWTVGVINSLGYVRKAKQQNTQHSGISVLPVYSAANKSVGAVGVWTF